MGINDYKNASQKLKWLKSAYQLWIHEQQFLLELRLTLDDEYNEVIPMLKAKEIKTKTTSGNAIDVFFDINNEETKKLHITYNEIEKLYQEITENVDQNLKERIN